MAGGWTRDGAVQEQIEDTVKDAIARARALTPQARERQQPPPHLHQTGRHRDRAAEQNERPPEEVVDAQELRYRVVRLDGGDQRRRREDDQTDGPQQRAKDDARLQRERAPHGSTR